MILQWSVVLVFWFMLPIVGGQVPSSGAARNIPKWWSKVLVIGECSSTRQCRPTECCVKLTGSRHRICLPLLQLGDSCRIVKNPGPIYTDACPCAEGLICRPNILPLTDVDECTPDSNFVRNQQLWFSFQQTIVQALRQKPRTFQHSNGTKKKVPMRRSDDENKTTE